MAQNKVNGSDNPNNMMIPPGEPNGNPAGIPGGRGVGGEPVTQKPMKKDHPKGVNPDDPHIPQSMPEGDAAKSAPSVMPGKPWLPDGVPGKRMPMTPGGPHPTKTPLKY